MNDYFWDIAVWPYILTLLISLYGAGLFVWWWRKKRSASSVFVYVTFIFIGEVLETAICLYTRYLLHVWGEARLVEFMLGPVWTFRGIITMVAFGFIVVHMSWRVFRDQEEI